MLLCTVYWVFALLSRKLTSEKSPCSYPFYKVKTPYSLSLQKDSNDWFIHCSQLFHRYNLPNIYKLKQHTNSKEILKEEIKHKIDTRVHQSWIEEGSRNLPLPILIYLTALWVGSTGVRGLLTTIPVTYIVLLLRLISYTGVYILQCNRAKLNQHAVSLVCCLCKGGYGTFCTGVLMAGSCQAEISNENTVNLVSNRCWCQH